LCEVVEKFLYLKRVTSTLTEALVALRDILAEGGIAIENCVANTFEYEILKCEISTSAKALLFTLRNILEEMGIVFENCFANFFGRGWRYAYILFLLVSDTTKILPSAISFFDYFKEAKVFLRNR
jgi:hypothetical protein